MPFINGRYHINPAMGHALEDARSAAEELLASDDPSHSSRDDDFTAGRADSSDERGPIHHIEIEAAETVPAHSGRAAHGFIARVHRRVSVGAQQEGPPGRRRVEPGGAGVPGADSRLDAAHPAPIRPETHVFTDHRDLLDFLRSEFARDGSR